MSDLISIIVTMAGACTIVRLIAWMAEVEPFQRFVYGILAAAFFAMISVAPSLWKIASQLWSREAAWMLVATGERELHIGRLETIGLCFAVACVVGEVLYRIMRELCWSPMDAWRR
jgi:hypothetical protein